MPFVWSLHSLSQAYHSDLSYMSFRSICFNPDQVSAITLVLDYRSDNCFFCWNVCRTWFWMLILHSSSNLEFYLCMYLSLTSAPCSLDSTLYFIPTVDFCSYWRDLSPSASRSLPNKLLVSPLKKVFFFLSPEHDRKWMGGRLVTCFSSWFHIILCSTSGEFVFFFKGKSNLNSYN